MIVSHSVVMGCQVPLERFEFLAIFQTDQKIRRYRLSNWHGGGKFFRYLGTGCGPQAA